MNKFQIYCLKKGFINIENYRRIREKNFNILFKSIKSNKIKLLTPNNFTKHSYINFPILVDDKKKFRDFLFKNNFDSSRYFYRNCNELKIFQKYKQNCINVKKLENNLVFLPIHHKISELYLKKLAKLINTY